MWVCRNGDNTLDETILLIVGHRMEVHVEVRAVLLLPRTWCVAVATLRNFDGGSNHPTDCRGAGWKCAYGSTEKFSKVVLVRETV